MPRWKRKREARPPLVLVVPDATVDHARAPAEREAAARHTEAYKDELLSVLTAGELPLWKEDVELPFVIEDVITLLAPRAAAKGVRLVPRVPEPTPAVRGDEGRIAQVLSRLLSNAIAFSPAGGAVVVRAVSQPGLVRVEVEDAGCGIPEPEQPKLFQRFRQLDMGLTRPHGGLGMGLFLCRRLIEAHGGRIGIKSSTGAGSTFWFTLPVAPRGSA